MKIVKSTVSNPDSDNEVSFQLEGAIENNTESIVELIKTSCLVINGDGICVNGVQDDEIDAFIDPGETAKVYLNSPYNVSAASFNNDIDGINAIVDAQLYRREFHVLGIVDVPKDEKTTSFIKKGVDIAGMVKILGASITRTKPDEDGTVGLNVAVGVRNVSDTYFERVTAKYILTDQEGAEIETGFDYRPIPPHSGQFLNTGAWNLQPGRLRNCTVKVTIYVYQPVAYQIGTTAFEKEP